MKSQTTTASCAADVSAPVEKIQSTGHGADRNEKKAVDTLSGFSPASWKRHRLWFRRSRIRIRFCLLSPFKCSVIPGCDMVIRKAVDNPHPIPIQYITQTYSPVNGKTRNPGDPVGWKFPIELHESAAPTFLFQRLYRRVGSQAPVEDEKMGRLGKGSRAVQIPESTRYWLESVWEYLRRYPRLSDIHLMRKNLLRSYLSKKIVNIPAAFGNITSLMCLTKI